MTQSSPPTCTWRPGDAEALRIALSIPVTSAALAALNREMAQLQTHYPTGVCTAQGHLDAIAALNEQLAALTPAEVNSPVRSRRKGVAGGVVPNPLPLRKLAVVEYATELLLEETESEWNPAGPSPAKSWRIHRPAAWKSARWCRPNHRANPSPRCRNGWCCMSGG